MSESPVRRFVVAEEGFRWAEVELKRYKEEGAARFRDVTRQTLFRRPDLRGELRYFEVAASGHSTLERHEHAHAVMILRGRGDVLIGSDVHSVGTFDLVTVPPATWHQFRASGRWPAWLSLHGRCRARSARAPSIRASSSDCARVLLPPRFSTRPRNADRTYRSTFLAKRQGRDLDARQGNVVAGSGDCANLPRKEAVRPPCAGARSHDRFDDPDVRRYGI